MVSGTISPPSRAAFHLSLTALVHYRSRKVFSLGSIVLPGSLEVVVPRVTQVRTNKDFLFSFTGLSPSLVARSRVLQLTKSLCFLSKSRYDLQHPDYTRKSNEVGVWTLPVSLAATAGMN